MAGGVKMFQKSHKGRKVSSNEEEEEMSSKNEEEEKVEERNEEIDFDWRLCQEGVSTYISSLGLQNESPHFSTHILKICSFSAFHSILTQADLENNNCVNFRFCFF